MLKRGEGQEGGLVGLVWLVGLEAVKKGVSVEWCFF